MYSAATGTTCKKLVIASAAVLLMLTGLHLLATPRPAGLFQFGAEQMSTLHAASRVIECMEVALLFAVLVLIRRSIRQRQQQAEAARESDWFARSTLDALSAQIAILDSSGTVLAVNRAWREQVGMVADSELVRPAEGENYLALCDAMAGRGRTGALAIAEGVRSVAIGQSGDAYAEYAGTVGGEARWFLCRITRFPGNVKVRIVMAHEDITPRKRAEEAADAARCEADAASQAKSAFLANMSHEIRTPMTAIVGYADLLLDPDQKPDERARCVQVIRRNGEHLLSIINDVLDLSKIEAQKYDVDCVRSDLRQLLSDVVSLTRVKAIQKGLNYKVIIDGPVPKEIRTDPLRLKQILVNLIGNAVKFTDAGGIYVRVSCQDRLIGSTLHIDVIDTGIGMSDDQINRLFKPFTQADESTTRRFGGTGLGLVISHKFAQLLGGDICVQSQRGMGTCFSVWVDTGPLGGVRMLPSLDEADLAAPSTTVGRSVSRFVGNVLVAEDGEDNQQLISLLLRNAGASVVLAPNGRIAMNHAREQVFDLILMDMQMPEMDGYTATRKLREDGYTPPIVALTANAMADDRAKCLAAGCDEYLAKPIRVEQLNGILARYLKPAPADPAATPGAAAAASLKSGLAENEKFRGVLMRFVARLPERIEEMQRLMREENLQQLARAIHQIKGAAGGYGFPDLTTAAGRAEQSIKQAEDLAAIEQQVQELISLIQRVDGFPHAGVQTIASAANEPAPASAPAPADPAPRTHVDAATGLPNRNNLLDRLSGSIASARRQQAPLACFTVCIDRYAEMQSTFGEETANALIRRLASALEDGWETELEVFRADACTLAMLLSPKDEPECSRLSQRLAAIIRETPLDGMLGDWSLSIRIGIGELQLTTTCAAELLSGAIRGAAGGISPSPSWKET
jgi:signal transduction histidine kinase/DNA-binding NarL/FixJ family response regulator/GGDEF domain-containing protein